MKSLGGSHRRYVKNEESIVSTTMFSYDRDTIRIIWVPFSFLLTVSHRSRGAWIEIANFGISG